MPRLSQAKRVTAKTSGGNSSGKNGEAHWLLQLWLTHRLYPACAIRGQNPDDFSLVPHKDDVISLLAYPVLNAHSLMHRQDKKLWCKLCKVGIQAKNEKNKHRHEQSDAHLDACAAALKLPKEELDRPYYWHCVDCNMKYVTRRQLPSSVAQNLIMRVTVDWLAQTAIPGTSLM